MHKLTAEQVMIIDMATSFTADNLRPNATRWERQGCFDRETFRALGELGFGGIYVAERLGGSALGRLDAVHIFEQLAKGCISTAAFLSIHNMAAWMIATYADDALRRQWVPKLASGEALMSYCLTESASGSDAASLQTTARLVDDHYILNGSKSFISGANFSELYLVMARTGGAGAKGISAFVVQAGTLGLSFGQPEQKMGWRAQPTAMVNFDDCSIPVANRVGAEGMGFKFAMAALDGGRLNIAACALGGAQEAFDRALVYAKERTQFGQAIAELQSIQFKLADMETQLQAARSLLYEAASRLDEKSADASKFCAMAKRFVTDTCFAVANEALQIHGGYGYLVDYQIERIVRDLRVHQILEGTNEIMRVIIARQLLAEA